MEGSKIEIIGMENLPEDKSNAKDPFLDNENKNSKKKNESVIRFLLKNMDKKFKYPLSMIIIVGLLVYLAVPKQHKSPISDILGINNTDKFAESLINQIINDHQNGNDVHQENSRKEALNGLIEAYIDQIENLLKAGFENFSEVSNGLSNLNSTLYKLENTEQIKLTSDLISNVSMTLKNTNELLFTIQELLKENDRQERKIKVNSAVEDQKLDNGSKTLNASDYEKSNELAAVIEGKESSNIEVSSEKTLENFFSTHSPLLTENNQNESQSSLYSEKNGTEELALLDEENFIINTPENIDQHNNALEEDNYESSGDLH